MSLAQLADALAGLSIEEQAPQRTVGLILDFHFLQVRALQYSLRTAWDVGLLEAALLSHCCADGQVLLRLAADSKLDSRGSNAGKRRLHDQLLAAGFELLTAPNKRTDAERKQGATDVHVVTALYRLAGAFAPRPPVTDIILVAADSDFQPALIDIVAARPALRLHVVAPPDCMRRSYRGWLRTHPQAHPHNLDDILDALAPHVLNFEAWRLPIVAGRLDFEQHLLLRPAAVRNAWGQLWIHHTDITDAAAPSLAQLVAILGGLTELHISDTAITYDGVALINAARSTLHCRLPLYVNARHLAPGPPSSSFPALTLALARKDYPGSPKFFHRKEHTKPFHKEHTGSPSKAQSSTPSKAQSSTPSKAESPSSSKAQSSTPNKAKSSTPSKTQSSTPSKAKSSTPSKLQSSTPNQSASKPKSPSASKPKSKPPTRREHPDSPASPLRKPFKRQAESPAKQ